MTFPNGALFVATCAGLAVVMSCAPASEAGEADCCVAAPPLLELDPAGNLMQTVGTVEADPMWPLMPHGVFVDHNDVVWVATSIYHQLMKFTRDGEHLLTIGTFDRVGGSNDTTLLGGSADVYVDPETNEVFVADGYNNSRATN
jgi:DNA-binding beta-propeller fold protein YncE